MPGQAERSRSRLLRWPPRLVATIVFALLLVVAAARAERLSANGVPIRFPLAYIDGLSNFGPTDARGSAELSYAEGLLKLDATGLPALTGGKYRAWLINSATNRALTVATFNSDTGGTVAYSGKIDSLTTYDYDLLLVTVESTTPAGAPPSDRRSIGGYFAAVQRPPSASPAARDTQPASLPFTGDVAAPSSRAPVSRRGLAAMFFGIGGLSLWATFRRRRTRS